MAFVRQNFIYNYEIGESQAVNWKTNSDRVKFRTRNSSRGNYPSQRNISWGLSSILVLVHSRRSLTSPAARGFSLKTQQNQGTAQRQRPDPHNHPGQRPLAAPGREFGSISLPCSWSRRDQKWHKTASSNTLQNSLQK